LNQYYTPPTPPLPLPIKEPWALLGGLSPADFMRDHWQKKPLLVRNAIPAFQLMKANGAELESPITPKDLSQFATSDMVESRLVQSAPWKLRHGPFTTKAIPSLTRKNWTLLVQGMEALHPAAATVLSWFRFIPDYRLDDLMISIAGPGGGVGPHLDSYDVFLIQMSGRRRWSIEHEPKKGFIDGLPLKILSEFNPDEEWLLEPGDMLYLPPQIAHDGIALDPGTQTWSVGFRSPSWRELLQETLWRLSDQLEDDSSLSQVITDPYQSATDKPALIPTRLTQELKKQFNQLPWHGKDLEELLEFSIGEILSEPKAQIVFHAPQKPLSENNFRQACLKSGLNVHSQTRLTISGDYMFCNGALLTYLDQKSDTLSAWLSLANQRAWTPIQARRFISYPSMFEAIYEGYLDGWFVLN